MGPLIFARCPSYMRAKKKRETLSAWMEAARCGVDGLREAILLQYDTFSTPSDQRLPQALAAPPTARPEDEDEGEQRNGGRNYDGVPLVGRKTRKGVVLQQDGLAQTIDAAPGCLHPRAERLHFVLQRTRPLPAGKEGR